MNFVVLCDFDGTITRIDTTEFVLSKFAQGNWQFFSDQFEKGEITLEDCLKKQFALVKVSKKEILNELDSIVAFRPNFGKLAKYCKENLIPLTVVSAGLDFVIKHFLELNNWQNLVETYTAKTKWTARSVKLDFPKPFDKASVNFKHDLVKQRRNQGKKVIYIGDGSGDYAAAKDADCLFAIKGSRLEELCENHGVSHKSVTDFLEVVTAMMRNNAN